MSGNEERKNGSKDPRGLKSSFRNSEKFKELRAQRLDLFQNKTRELKKMSLKRVRDIKNNISKGKNFLVNVDDAKSCMLSGVLKTKDDLLEHGNYIPMYVDLANNVTALSDNLTGKSEVKEVDNNDLDVLGKIKVYKYRVGNSMKKCYGFDAVQVDKVAKDLTVNVNKDPTYVKLQQIVPLLLECIKRQNTQIEELTNRVKKLEKK